MKSLISHTILLLTCKSLHALAAPHVLDPLHPCTLALLRNCSLQPMVCSPSSKPDFRLIQAEPSAPQRQLFGMTAQKVSSATQKPSLNWCFWSLCHLFGSFIKHQESATCVPELQNWKSFKNLFSCLSQAPKWGGLQWKWKPLWTESVLNPSVSDDDKLVPPPSQTVLFLYYISLWWHLCICLVQ